VERSRKWILNAQKQNRKLLRDRCDLFLDAEFGFDAKLLPEKSEKKGARKNSQHTKAVPENRWVIPMF